MVVNLQTPEEEIIERVVSRRVCSNPECKTIYNVIINPPKVDGVCDICGGKVIQRDDDSLETIKKRLSNYFKLTEPLVEYYKKQNILYNTIVSQSINKMGKDVAKEIEEYVKKGDF